MTAVTAGLFKRTSSNEPNRMDTLSARGQAADAEERARELMTMAAHDLRSPLASIRFMSFSVIERWRAGEKPACEEWASVVVRICDAAADAFALINDVLAIERLEQQGAAASRLECLDMQLVIEEAIEREKVALESARCAVTVRRQRGVTSVHGHWDRAYLLCVFGNLFRNAAKNAPGAPIAITLMRRGDRLGVLFADHRPGLSAVMANNPASRHRRAGVVGEVHGLGLWIVRRAVERLGGILRIRNRAGKGVTFDVELPGLER